MAAERLGVFYFNKAINKIYLFLQIPNAQHGIVALD
jgi:hypothetical protein